MAVDLQVSFGPLKLKNPLIAASGTFGYGREYGEIYDVSRLGALVSKSVTLKTRAGNAPPRVVETASGMLNSIGLANAGLGHFLTKELPAMRRLGTAVIVNIAGKTVAEFEELAEAVGAQDGVSAVEINVSCPNVKEGGMAFGVDPAATRRVVRAVRRKTRLPIITKLTPNVTSITDVARAAADGGSDILSLINTLLAMAVDWRRRRPVLGGVTGGLSGPAIKPVALRMVYEVARLGVAPVIGIGGIMTADDVLEFLVAGATAVQFGTANFADPMAGIRLLAELEGTLAAHRVDKVSDLVGTLRDDM
ncbi:MAG: dihydroorotate dehydrogenase [Planctomycetota bacterium]